MYSSLSEYPACAGIEPADRIICGWVGITKAACVSFGCCYAAGGGCFRYDGQSSNCKYISVVKKNVKEIKVGHNDYELCNG